MNLDELAHDLHERFDLRMHAREQALPAARRAIRSCANAIRAIHRAEWITAHRLMDEARTSLDEGLGAVADQPEIRSAGYLQDAQKEYAEACITEAVLGGANLPTNEDLDVELAPYLNGMAEAIGEGRRAILDLLRRGEFERSESILGAMDDIYHLLVSVDFPDAITRNLRHSTDQARGILERTRGDLSISLVQRNLLQAMERHADRVLGDGA